MTDSTLDKKLSHGIEALQRLRDHLRVEMHLARMDAKQQWERLQPDMFRASQLGDEVAKISLKALEDVQRAIHDYRAATKARHDRQAPPVAPKDRRSGAAPPGLR